MVKWEKYEEQIFKKLKEEIQNAQIIKNCYLQGIFSKIKRQVDILVIGELAGKPIKCVVDCKCFNRKVNVRTIDNFIGFLEDVKVNLGIIITTKGYSNAAKNRAECKNIYLDIVQFQEIDEYHIELEICKLCDPREDRPLPFIEWKRSLDWGAPDNTFINEFEETTLLIGRCQWCNGINIKCMKCGAITGVSEYEYNKKLECEGCGIKFIVWSEHDEKDLFEEYLEVIDD